MKRKNLDEPGPPVDDPEALIYGRTQRPSDDAYVDDLRFDYSSFEASLEQHNPQKTPEAAPPPRADAVQQRKTIDVAAIPKDDAVYDIRRLGTFQVVTIRGQLNESFKGRVVGSQLQGPALFDLTEVDRVTSFGVRSWLEMLEVSRMTFAAFVRASPAVINQITMMRNFCGSAKLQSLVAPYACASCGNGFGVPFDAIADRTILRSRNPPKVLCPECRSAAEIDEDPWVYFDLDDHLLDKISPDLQQVLDHLGDGPRRPPVEKAISGDITRLRLNGKVDASSRLQRAFGGLEGKVVLDLRTLTHIDLGGVDNLFGHLGRLPDEVSELIVEGAPVPMVQRLFDNRPPRVYVRSVATTVRSLARPLKRRLCVDLKRNQAALRAQQPPDLDLPWRDDPIELEGRELLSEALWLMPKAANADPRAGAPGGGSAIGGAVNPAMLGAVPGSGPMGGAPAPLTGHGTPAALGSHPGTHPGTPHPGTPHPGPGRPLGGHSLAPHMTGSFPQPAPAQAAPAPPRRLRVPWVPLFLLAATLFVVVFIGTTGVALVITQGLGPARAAGTGLTVAENGWRGGGELPPPWAELQLAESDGTVYITGRGTAETADAALAAARSEASDIVLALLGREMRLMFDDEALAPDGSDARAEDERNWQLSAAGLMFSRVQDDARKVDGNIEVVAQYAVKRTELDHFADRYQRQVEFRGLTVAPSAPWRPAGLRLVRRDSYIRNVEPGDVLRTVGNSAVSKVDDFLAVAKSSYANIEEGESLQFVFDRKGQGVITSIYKPKARRDPAPAPANRPTLFKKD